jgi:copper chaperone CopZ
MINTPNDPRDRQLMQHRLIVSINPMPRDGQAVQSLMERIEKMPGVRSVSIHSHTEMAYVIFDDTVISADAIIAAINDQVVHQREFRNGNQSKRHDD